MEYKRASSKTKMNNKEQSISQQDFFNYITIVSKAIQNLETEHNEQKFNGLVYIINKNVKSKISEESDFLKSYFIDDKNISPIQEIKSASKKLDTYLKKNDKVSITNHWCKMNKINKMIKKPPSFYIVPHNINSILFVIFNRGILSIDWDEDMTYVNISIDKDTDVEDAICNKSFNKSFNNSFNKSSNHKAKESMDLSKVKQALDDDDDDDEED